MSETIAAVLPGLAQDVEAKPYTLTLLERSLAEQGDLSAVERFSARHDADTPDLKTGIYRALLPARAPAPGEQFAFEVDLDACSGCKACVTACHSLNGLDEAETWRSVGFLHGGSAGTFAAGLLASRSSSDLPASFSVIAVSAAGRTRGRSRASPPSSSS